MAIRRLFIANRGEIAMRIIRAARVLGIETVQAYSEADHEMSAVREADAAVCIGPAPASQSYLDISAVIEAARSAGANAVHPGYGFLAENAAFAEAVVAAGMVFVGPEARTIERMGDKVAAREAARAAGVPIVPGSDGRLDDVAAAVEAAREIGYPVMLKAAAGGGGRGIRIAANEDELRRLAPQARAEAQAAFGDGGLYLEKAIERPRHIEVQIMGDGTSAIHCFERECSVQRRRQKVWEEAGAPGLSQVSRAAMCDAAVRLAEAVGYRGAGTVEFLYDEAGDAFYFIEMNTRIQVEHTVTEMITGLDLVVMMIEIAGGALLPLTQKQVVRDGHAIEVRICAEDPLLQFAPFPGTVSGLSWPEGEGVRVDHFLYEGYTVPPFYDSLLGKLVVHAADRATAIERMAQALRGCRIEGLRTTIPLHLALAADPALRSGKVHTGWLETWLADGGLKAAAQGETL